MKVCSQQIYFSDYLLHILLLGLAVLQQSNSASPYNIVSMNDACSSTSSNRNQIRLSAVGSNSAASLVFDVLDRERKASFCAVDIHAASTHAISLQLGDAMHQLPSPRRDGFASVVSRKYHQACPLSVFSLGKSGKVPRLLRSVDLCDNNPRLSLSELYPRHHLTIIWTPPHSNFSDRIQVTELIVTAVGIGRAVCKKHPNFVPSHFPCWKQYSKTTSFCIATELICDGRRNCPNEGEDEDPTFCAALITKPVEAKNKSMLDDANEPTAHNSSHLANNNVALQDEDAVVIDQQWNTTIKEKIGLENKTESFPEALAQYGPWGYLMLGTLICGSVIMVCGVWECICRRHKRTNITPLGPDTIFVITPACTPEEAALPPAYDDLDQPPAYNILFPLPLKVDLSASATSNINEEQRTES